MKQNYCENSIMNTIVMKYLNNNQTMCELKEMNNSFL